MNRFSSRLVVIVLLGVFSVFLFTGFAQASATYTVQNGDSLFLIANRFGVTVSAIQSASGLTGNTIYAGQQLVIPGGTSSVTRYIIQTGDTLYLIARKFGVSVDTLRKQNNLWKDYIYAGQVLIVPGGKSNTVSIASRGLPRNDLNLLARVVFAEARGEGYTGQVAVAAVILNRVNNPNFPKTISGVIYEPGAFSCVDDGQINLAPDATAYKAAQDAINGWDPTSGAIYYWNPATAQSKWIWSRSITIQIGNHVFAK